MIKLDIPVFKNEKSDDCFVACVAMVLDYYKKDIDRDYFYKEALTYNNKQSDGCTPPSISFPLGKNGFSLKAHYYLNQTEIKSGGQEDIEYFKEWKTQEKEAEEKHYLEKINTTNDKISTIDGYLQKKIPVIVGVQSKTFYEGNKYWENSEYMKNNTDEQLENLSHVIVVTGYDDNNYFYNDSSPFLPENKSKNLTVSKELLEKSYNNVKCVKNGFFIIEKKL